MTDVIDRIRKAAKDSPARHLDWPHGQGVAAIGYTEGMAVTFGRVHCKLKAADPAVVAMAAANTGDATRDVLAHYADRFTALSMSNDAAGIDTLRHLFVLMMGLGMEESSGQHCEGRDRGADNTGSDTAEAGLFQTSYNACTSHPLLPGLFAAYRARPSGFVDIFKQGVHCSAASWQNWGTGDGRDFQQLSKECPAFAVEFAALGLRCVRTHWGPINRKRADVRSECDDLFRTVQQIVDATPGASVDLV